MALLWSFFIHPYALKGYENYIYFLLLQFPFFFFTFIHLDDGIDSTWTATTKHMSPRELSKWRKELYSIYTGYLPCDITKVKG